MPINQYALFSCSYPTCIYSGNVQDMSGGFLEFMVFQDSYVKNFTFPGLNVAVMFNYISYLIQCASFYVVYFGEPIPF